MKKINYKSDFDFVLCLKDCDGNVLPFPDCDWDALFWTTKRHAGIYASYRNGICMNCRREEDGSFRFVFNGHRLDPGTLKWEPHFSMPNNIYPDGIQDLFDKAWLGIELVDGPGDCGSVAEAVALMPYIRGEPMTWSGMTEDERQQLLKDISNQISIGEASELTDEEIINCINSIVQKQHTINH